jgi:hypothetical protein
MAHEDHAVVELQKKKSKKEKGEYMRPISPPSPSALNVKISATDHEAKQAETELAKKQDDGHSLEVKEKRKNKKGKGKDTEEPTVTRPEDTPGELSIFPASTLGAKAYEYTSCSYGDIQEEEEEEEEGKI